MTYAQERHIDAIEDAAAELLRRVRAACNGKKALPEAVNAIKQAAEKAKAIALTDE